MRAPLRLALALAPWILLAPRVARAVTHTFTFRGSFAPLEGGTSLEPVYNGGAMPVVLAAGDPGFVNGSFVTQTISATACPSPPTVQGWSFPARGGLRHPNMAPVIASGSYTISMLVRFDPLPGGYVRLVDFSNSTLDTGIYVLNNGVSFYPVGTYAMDSFASARDTFITLTRDATTRAVNLYINGTAAGSYTDDMNLYAPASGTLYFFLDNTTGSAAISESAAGTVAYLQVSDAPIAPTAVAASLAGICQTVRCGDGVLNPGEGCDSGRSQGSASCDPTCRVLSGSPCNAMAPGETGSASCASGLCLTAGTPAPGRCVDCVDDSRCGGATPRCDVTTNSCVPARDAGASDSAVTDAPASDVGADAGSGDAGAPDVIRDAGVMTADLGRADAPAAVDVVTPVDARTAADAGGAVDAGSDRDAGGAGDAGEFVDAGPQGSGCGCRASRAGSREGALLLGLGALAARRRRRRTPRD
ncbi:MAG: hypothetical protein U0325_22575 [Polyangiales bacterium]